MVVSDDLSRIDLDAVCRLLASSYWAATRPREVIERSLQSSIVFGLYCSEGQIGFARAVTDRATFTWIADVIVDPRHRGKGLGRWLVECVLSHPDVRDTMQLLRTKDAHSLYERFGFERDECMIHRSPTHKWA